MRIFFLASRARWVEGSLMGSFSRINSLLVFRNLLTRKLLAYFGTVIWRRPEVETVNFTPLTRAFLRTKTSPNSLSVITTIVYSPSG